MESENKLNKVDIGNMYSRLIYTSVLLDAVNNSEELFKIASISQKNNAPLGIGGKLIWEQQLSTIIQILEGPSININKLFDKIKKDKRHKNVRMVACEEILPQDIIYPVWTASLFSNKTKIEPDINDFQILSVIGTGGFATVVKAFNKITNNFVAIKIMTKKKLSSKNYNTALRERYIWKTLNGSNFINKLYYCLQDPINVYFVMDFSMRGDMYSCSKSCKLNYETCIFYFSEILCGLRTIHNHKIIFGDLKLENILIDKTGHILLTDFGISRKQDEEDKTVRGTPVYFAPEMITDKIIHTSNDIWALGIVLYEMTGSALPWQGLDKQTMYLMILNRQLSLDVWYSNILNELIQMTTTKQYLERPDSNALIGYLKNEKIVDWNLIESRKFEPPHLPNIVNEQNNVVMNFNL